MANRIGIIVLLLTLLLCVCATATEGKHGMTFVFRPSAGYDEDLVTYNLYRLADLGVNSLCILAMWFLDDLEDPTLEPWYLDEPGFPDDGFFYPTLRDHEIAFVSDLAHSLGMSVMLKLHSEPLDWSTRGDTAPGHEALHPADSDWDTLFDSYRGFLEHYAALSQDLGIEILCIGTEIESMTIPSQDGPSDPDARWRELIASARQQYDGKLTYSTSFGGLFPQVPGSSSQEQISFWDALDYIGIEFYAGLSTEKDPAYDTLLGNLRWIFETFYKPLALAYDRPILIPEVAFASFDGANMTIEPELTPFDMRIHDHEEQAACHRALVQVVDENDYVEGLYWWAGTLVQPNDGHHWQTTGTDSYLWGKPVEAMLRTVWEESRPFGPSTQIPVSATEEGTANPGNASRMEILPSLGGQGFVKAVPGTGWWFEHWEGEVDLPFYPIARLMNESDVAPTAVFRRSPCASCLTDPRQEYGSVVVDGFSQDATPHRQLDAFWATADSRGCQETAPAFHEGRAVMSYRYPQDGDQKLFLKFETPYDASSWSGVEVIMMAERPTSVRVEIASQDPGLEHRMNEDDWKTMYPNCSLEVTETWQTFRLPFVDFIMDPDELFRFPGVSPGLIADAIWEIQFFVQELNQEILIQKVAFYRDLSL